MEKYEYDKNKGCLHFSLQEIKEKLVEPIEKKYGIKAEYYFCDRITSPADEIGKLQNVSFPYDGEENIDIHFLDGGMVGFFVCDDVILFIDDKVKPIVRGVEECIIYEGSLNNQSTDQIFQIFLNIFDILYGVQNLKFEEKLIGKIGYYRVNEYDVKLFKKIPCKAEIRIENIFFHIK